MGGSNGKCSKKGVDMVRSHKSGAINYVHASPSLNNIHIRISNYQSITSAYCKKDKIQWFYLVTHNEGFSDYEEASCSCCGGTLFRGQNLPSGFSTSESLEAIAWLEKHPTKSKTLILVCLQSSLEIVESVLLNHIQRQSFSGLYNHVDVMESGSILNRQKQGKNRTLLVRKKQLSMLSLLSSIQIKKTKKRKQGKDTLLLDELKEKVTLQGKKKSRRRTKLSGSAKQALQKLEESTQESLNQRKHFSKNQKKLSTQNQKKFSKKDLINLGKRLNVNFVKQMPRQILSSVVLVPLILRRMEAAHLLDTGKEETGLLTRKEWVSVIRRV